MDDEKFIIEYTDKHREIVNTGRYRLQRPRILQWRVQYKGFLKKEWDHVSEFWHSLPDDWLEYDRKHNMDVGTKDVKSVGVRWRIQRLMCPSS